MQDISAVTKLIDAAKAGNQLANPAIWKKGQELTNLIGATIAGIITLVRFFYPDVMIPDGATEHIAEFIGGALVLVNLYLTRATTKKDLSTIAVLSDVK